MSVATHAASAVSERLREKRFSAIQFLLVLVAMLATIPFVETVRGAGVIESALLTAVLLSAVIAVGGSRRMRLVAYALIVPALVTRWLSHAWPEMVPRSVATAAAIVFTVFIVFALLRFVLRSEVVDANVLCAASSAYLLMGVLWAFAYSLVSELSPNAFSFGGDMRDGRELIGFEAMYFSFATLTTVGYGDIAPVARAARLLAMCEAVAGVFFMTVLIARLVSNYSSNKQLVRRSR